MSKIITKERLFNAFCSIPRGVEVSVYKPIADLYKFDIAYTVEWGMNSIKEVPGRKLEFFNS